MADKERKKRRYDSTRRQAQARQTRRAITEAAHRLFVERGYAGATIDAIAEEAGVAAETVYAVFGSKRAILSHLAGVLLVGDDEPIPLLERPGPLATRQERDQRQQIWLFAAQMREIMTRMAPIFDILRTAAKTEPDIADLRSQMLGERRQGMRQFVEIVMANGPLREGLAVDEAADIVFALSSGECFGVFTGDLGWSGERYEAWLADALTRSLLPRRA